MRITILSAFFVLFASALSAQDVIHRTDKSEIKSKVLEITPTLVKYKRSDHLEGPTYTIARSEVVKIVYKNGRTDSFNIASMFEMEEEENEVAVEAHVISFDLFDVVYRNFAVSYEYINAKGNLGYRIPLSMGLRAENEVGQIFRSGLDLNFYPNGQGMIKYFLGPALHGGVERDLYFFEEVNYSSESSLFYMLLKFNNGVVFRPSEQLQLSVVGEMGFRYIPDLGNNHGINTYYGASLNFGFRF